MVTIGSFCPSADTIVWTRPSIPLVVPGWHSRPVRYLLYRLSRCAPRSPRLSRSERARRVPSPYHGLRSSAGVRPNILFPLRSPSSVPVDSCGWRAPSPIAQRLPLLVSGRPRSVSRPTSADSIPRRLEPVIPIPTPNLEIPPLRLR
jgi:hypothetical protein